MQNFRLQGAALPKAIPEAGTVMLCTPSPYRGDSRDPNRSFLLNMGCFCKESNGLEGHK